MPFLSLIRVICNLKRLPGDGLKVCGGYMKMHLSNCHVEISLVCYGMKQRKEGCTTDIDVDTCPLMSVAEKPAQQVSSHLWGEHFLAVRLLSGHYLGVDTMSCDWDSPSLSSVHTRFDTTTRWFCLLAFSPLLFLLVVMAGLCESGRRWLRELTYSRWLWDRGVETRRSVVGIRGEIVPL